MSADTLWPESSATALWLTTAFKANVNQEYPCSYGSVARGITDETSVHLQFVGADGYTIVVTVACQSRYKQISPGHPRSS